VSFPSAASAPLAFLLSGSCQSSKPFICNTFKTCTILVQIGPFKFFRMSSSVNLSKQMILSLLE
jgi:hypothetical protein